MNLIICERLLYLYKNGLASEKTIRNAVIYNMITAKQYEDIVGTTY